MSHTSLVVGCGEPSKMGYLPKHPGLGCIHRVYTESCLLAGIPKRGGGLISHYRTQFQLDAGPTKNLIRFTAAMRYCEASVSALFPHNP
jgi:hypothetical protein